MTVRAEGQWLRPYRSAKRASVVCRAGVVGGPAGFGSVVDPAVADPGVADSEVADSIVASAGSISGDTGSVGVAGEATLLFFRRSRISANTK